MASSHHQELINSILSLPNAPIIMNKVNQQLKAEKIKRENFYNEITDEEKVEFINGEIIVHSPVKKEHNDASRFLHQLLGPYVGMNELGYIGYEKIMITLSRNDYEPDLCFFKKAKAKAFKDGQSLFPAPDLVVEVLSKGTSKNDRGIKFEDYQAHEVMEYWIVDPIKKIIEQYQLNKSKKYELILKAKSGTIESKAVKGFSFKIAAIFEEKKNMEELMRLLKVK